jgi:hypothetical protein
MAKFRINNMEILHIFCGKKDCGGRKSMKKISEVHTNGLWDMSVFECPTCGNQTVLEWEEKEDKEYYREEYRIGTP